jgi:hypothetical protein
MVRHCCTATKGPAWHYLYPLCMPLCKSHPMVDPLILSNPSSSIICPSQSGFECKSLISSLTSFGVKKKSMVSNPVVS